MIDPLFVSHPKIQPFVFQVRTTRWSRSAARQRPSPSAPWRAASKSVSHPTPPGVTQPKANPAHQQQLPPPQLAHQQLPQLEGQPSPSPERRRRAARPLSSRWAPVRSGSRRATLTSSTGMSAAQHAPQQTGSREHRVNHSTEALSDPDCPTWRQRTAGAPTAPPGKPRSTGKRMGCRTKGHRSSVAWGTNSAEWAFNSRYNFKVRIRAWPRRWCKRPAQTEQSQLFLRDNACRVILTWRGDRNLWRPDHYSEGKDCWLSRDGTSVESQEIWNGEMCELLSHPASTNAEGLWSDQTDVQLKTVAMLFVLGLEEEKRHYYSVKTLWENARRATYMALIKPLYNVILLIQVFQIWFGCSEKKIDSRHRKKIWSEYTYFNVFYSDIFNCDPIVPTYTSISPLLQSLHCMNLWKINENH